MSLFAATKQRYLQLRSQLDDHGFKNSLSVDSLVLVENLWNEVLMLREVGPRCETANSSLEETKAINDHYIDAYKTENACLIKENNDLHLKLIHQTEHYEDTIKNLKHKIRQFETENADLKFLNNQYLQKNKELEYQASEKNRYILQLQGKTAKPIVRVRDGKNKDNAIRQSEMEIDSLLARTNGNKIIQNSQPSPNRSLLDQASDPYVADMLKFADLRIVHLEDNVKTSQKTCIEMRDVINGMEKKLQARNSEIERLQKLLSDGRPIEAIAFDNLKKSFLDQIKHLEMQVSYLQDENAKFKNSETNQKFNKFSSSGNMKRQQNTRTYVNNCTISISQINSSFNFQNEHKLSNIDQKNEANKNFEKIVKALKNGDKESKETIKRLLVNEKDLMLEIDRLSGLIKSSEINEYHQNCTCSHTNLEVPHASVCQHSLKMHDRHNSIAKNIEINKSSDTRVIIEKLEEERDFFRQCFDEMKEIFISTQPLKVLSELDRLQAELKCIKIKISNETPYPSDSELTKIIPQPPHHTLSCPVTQQQYLKKESLNFLNTLHQISENSAKNEQQIELEELLRTLISHKEIVKSLENQAIEKSLKLTSTQNELEKEKFDSNQIKMKLHEAIKTLKSTEINLNEIQSKDEMKLKNYQCAKEENEKMNSEVSLLMKKISALSNSVSKLDQEKDSIQSLLDAKTENVIKLQNSLTAKQKEISLLKTTISTLEIENDQGKGLIVSTDQSLRSMKNQLGNALQDIKELQEERNLLQTLNKQLEDDLVTQQLNIQIVDYVTEVKRIEELFTAKDKERNDLLEQYHNLSCEANSLKDQVSEQQAHTNSVKMELFSSDSDNRYLQDTISRLDRELDDYRTNSQHMDWEVTRLTYQLSAAEEELEDSQISQEKLTTDLQIERDLNVALQTSKSKLKIKLSDTTKKLEETMAILQVAQHEVTASKSELAVKNDTIAAFEDLLTNKREQEFEAEKLVNYLSEEFQLLQIQLQEAESKITNQSEEISAHQTKASVLDAETEKLKHQLINERFERERAIQKFLQLQQEKIAKISRPGNIHPISVNSEAKTVKNNIMQSTSIVEECKSSESAAENVNRISSEPEDQPSSSDKSINLKDSVSDAGVPNMKQNGVKVKSSSTFYLRNVLQKFSSSDSK
ncbi:Centrosomal protein [Nymphon striatum]|nr:Centrosomal protein [Nymphon striatum]